jgi:hypothetical protein
MTTNPVVLLIFPRQVDGIYDAAGFTLLSSQRDYPELERNFRS